MFTKSPQGYAILSSNPVEKGACPMPRQSQNQSPAPSRKKALLSVAILLALTGVLILLFQDHWAEISAALAQLSLGQVALVLALGITYPLLEGVASWLIVRSRLPGFTLRHGIDNAWMGTFGNVICLGAGAVPMQTYYLHRCGLGLGPGVGLMTLQYVFHKAAVLVYATVLLLWNRQWFTAHATGVLSYLPAAYTVVAGVILGLVLLCTAPLVQSLARRALGLLPKTEKWQARRESWQTQLDTLSEESRHLLTEKSRCLKIFAVHLCKLFLMYTIPYFCLRFMGLSSALSFGQVQLLTALMLFLSNALPNVAGMGSIETAFLLVFGAFLTRGEAMSVLMLFRIATYYVVVAVSAVGFFFAQKNAKKLR